MAASGYASRPAGIASAVRPALAVLFVTLVIAIPPLASRAHPISDDRPRNPCRILSASLAPDHDCGWFFDDIARVQADTASEAGAPASPGRLNRLGFVTSDLTIAETLTELASGRARLLPWDREVGIADELTASMEITIDAASLSATRFLLMPATFNDAYLSDFVDFTACQTAHTFIFAGALDGRSDAPYVTHRWEEMKVDVCLDIAGADCSKAELEVEPARLYFHGNWPCRYTPRRTAIGRGPTGD